MIEAHPVDRGFTLACWVLILSSLVLQGAGILHRNLNGDEFIFLARVHVLDQGRAVPVLQTAYAWFFGWLPGVSGNEVVQVQAGRLALLAVWAFTLFLLYRLARHVVEAPGALAAVTLAATLREDLIHAASFRVDGLLAAAFLGACLAAVRPTARRVLASGVLAGVMMALSIKTVLLLPVVAAILLLADGQGTRPRWRALGGWVMVAALATTGFLALHAFLIPQAPVAVAGGPPTTTAFLRNAGVRMLLEGGLLPRWGTLVDALVWNAPAWLLMDIGVVMAARRRGASWRLLPLFVAPVAAFLFYRNFFPYAFVSLALTLWITAGAGWWWAIRGRIAVGRWLAWGAFAWFALVQLSVARTLVSDDTVLQRQTLDVVHGLFPDPVPYIDRTGMVASFPRPLFNMTTFGMETYRAAGEAALTSYIQENHPPLLIRNTNSLDVFPDAPPLDPDPRPALLPEDALQVAETYTHFWGPIFLAGGAWAQLDAVSDVTFSVHVPGPYTLLAADTATVDGSLLAPGQSVSLSVGAHTIRAHRGHLSSVRLVWGREVRLPSLTPAPGPVFRGF